MRIELRERDPSVVDLRRARRDWSCRIEGREASGSLLYSESPDVLPLAA